MPTEIPRVNPAQQLSATEENRKIDMMNSIAGIDGDVEVGPNKISFPEQPDIIPNKAKAVLVTASAVLGEEFNTGEFGVIKYVAFPDGDIAQANTGVSVIISKYEPDVLATDGSLIGQIVICQSRIANIDTPPENAENKSGLVAISGYTLAVVKRHASFVDMNSKEIFAYAAPEEDAQILNIGFGDAVGEVIAEEDVVDKTLFHWAWINMDNKTPKGPNTSSGDVIVKNLVDDGGGGFEDLPSAGQILGLDGSYFDPSSESDEFKRLPSFNGIAPEDGVHDDKFAITLEQCAGEKFCRAVTNGCAWCMVDVIDEDHDQVKIIDGDYEKLESTDDGYGKILDKESGTGLKRAYVRIPFKKAAAGGDIIRVIGIAYPRSEYDENVTFAESLTIDNSDNVQHPLSNFNHYKNGFKTDGSEVVTYEQDIYVNLPSPIDISVTPRTYIRYAYWDCRARTSWSPVLSVSFFDEELDLATITTWAGRPLGDTIVTYQSDERINGDFLDFPDAGPGRFPRNYRRSFEVVSGSSTTISALRFSVQPGNNSNLVWKDLISCPTAICFSSRRLLL